jgi:hypothetical protein
MWLHNQKSVDKHFNTLHGELPREKLQRWALSHFFFFWILFLFYFSRPIPIAGSFVMIGIFYFCPKGFCMHILQFFF